MSRKSWDPNSKPELIYNAVELWRDRCLLDNISIFTDKKLWTKENFTKHLQECFIENLDASEGEFWNKLESQLKSAPPETRQLMAEICWVMLLMLGDRDISSNNKIERIKKIWLLSGEDFPESKKLIGCLHQNIASMGLAQTRYYIDGLYYFVLWLQNWKSKSLEKQRDLIKDHRKFVADLRDWEDNTYRKAVRAERQKKYPIKINTTMRRVVLHLLFPDDFESVLTKKDRKRIIDAYAPENKEKGTDWIIDDELLFKIRQKIETEREREGKPRDFNFYEHEYKREWNEKYRNKVEEKPTDYLLNKMNHPLNQILYGPPGTGKTYATRRMAVKIIDGANAPADDEEIKKRYKELEYDKDTNKDGKIWFVTFHQSYGYEDFVEGIKPSVEEEEENITYKIKDGIFKEICKEASKVKKDNFDKVLKELKEKCEDEYNLSLKTLARKRAFDLKYNTATDTFHVRRQGRDDEKTTTPVPIDGLETLHKYGSQYRYNSSYIESIYQYMVNEMGLKEFPKDAKPEGRYVLIIDEINRGNISKILGELITLLEKDKREGEKEELGVELAYSKKKFRVPNNVYIIGTMNTADRSIAFLDTALRRRFRFKEMMPNTSLLEEQIIEGISINIEEMLNTINEKITEHLDRDHQIGHSYFLKLQQEDLSEKERFTELQAIFEESILPLLREYFFGQNDKIKDILCDAFFKKDNNNERLLEGDLLKEELQKPEIYRQIYENPDKTSV